MSLKIDVTPLMQEVGRTSSIVVDEQLSWPDDGLIMSEPVHIEANLLNTSESILLNANVTARVKLECSRCLEKYGHLLKFEFEEEYSQNPSPPAKIKGEAELTNNDFIFKIDRDNTIDLAETIRQNILTELPIKPLCPKCPEQEGGE